MTLRPLQPPFYRGVQAQLRTRLERAGHDGLLVLDSANVVYLSGFFHSANERPIGLYVPVAGEPVLLVPLLERENAEAGWIGDVRSYAEFPGVEHPLAWMVRSVGARRLAVDALSARDHALVAGLVAQLTLSDSVAELRAVKSAEELALVREAARYADLCLDTIHAHIVDMVRGGATELEVLALGMATAHAALLRDHGAALGATKLGITGSLHSGPRAALPHGKTMARMPQRGETIIAGIGAAVGGYHAESGVTLVLGEPTRDQAACLQAAIAANDAAIAALTPGAACEAVNAAALAEIHAAGFGDAIRHRIGHGMGIQGHEAPWLAPGDGTILRPGMVFSNEPGIYRPGIDGYRMINTMIVTDSGVELPSRFQARHPLAARILPL